MRRAARIDGNHQKIVEALRACGASVVSLASQGSGVPDILCARNGQMYLLEVKRAELQGKRPPTLKERITAETQAKWRARWRAPVHVVYDVDQALAAIGVAV